MTYPIQAKYNQFNNQYFKGSLPSIPLSLKPLKGVGGVVRFQIRKPVGAPVQGVLVPGSVTLTLSTLFQNTEAHMDAILLHEMIHVHFVNIGDYQENHGAKFMAMRNQLSQASGMLIPVTERVAGDINLTSSKTKPYGVLLLRKPTGYSYGVISISAMANVEALKETWTQRALYGRFGVALYTIDSLLWSTKAASVKVSRGDPIKNLYIMQDDRLAQDLFRNGNLVFAIQETPRT